MIESTGLCSRQCWREMQPDAGGWSGEILCFGSRGEQGDGWVCSVLIGVADVHQ